MATVNSRDAGIAVNGSYTAAIDFVGKLLAAGVIETTEDFVDESVALITDLARKLADARLALTAEVVADYPEPPKGGSGGGKRPFNSGGNRSGGGKSTTSTDPATEKQIKFINDLVEQKGVDVDTDGMTKADAAAAIEKLLSTADAS